MGKLWKTPGLPENGVIGRFFEVFGNFSTFARCGKPR